MSSIIKSGLSDLTPQDLVSKAATLVDKMTGNPKFPTPNPDLADITAAIAEVNAAIEKSQFGDKQAILLRNTKMRVLKDLLRTLAGYVGVTAQGDPNIILSSGFEVRRKPSPRPPVSRPVALKADRSSKTGQIKLAWQPVKGSKQYIVEMATTDPIDPNTVFTLVGYTSKAGYLVDNLEPGTYCWFRVKTLGSNSESSFSDPAVVMVA